MIENEKPSERIRYAVEALQEVLDGKVPNVKPCMSVFHGFLLEPNICYSCLGGIAAIKRYNLDVALIEKHVTEYNGGVSFTESMNKFGDSVGSYERSLDYARNGIIDDMFDEMDLDPNKGTDFNQYIAQFDETEPQPFISDLLKLAQKLEDGGY